MEKFADCCVCEDHSKSAQMEVYWLPTIFHNLRTLAELFVIWTFQARGFKTIFRRCARRVTQWSFWKTETFGKSCYTCTIFPRISILSIEFQNRMAEDIAVRFLQACNHRPGFRIELSIEKPHFEAYACRTIYFDLARLRFFVRNSRMSLWFSGVA